jgi:O-acetyl-ADP-ribose deacetylase (regulator of RNase III)
VFLNLSGGVGGEILLRYGDAMQRELHRHLQLRGVRHVERGYVVETGPSGAPFDVVLHAVAVDGLYQSSPDVIREVVDRSLRVAAERGARRVALTALGTGFGRLSMTQFGQGVAALASTEYPPVAEVVICVRKEWELDDLAAAAPFARRA